MALRRLCLVKSRSSQNRNAENHPDKTAHLGPEFKTLSEEKFREIQQAYERLTGNGRKS